MVLSPLKKQGTAPPSLSWVRRRMSFTVPKEDIKLIGSKYWKSPQEVFWFIPGPKQASSGMHRRCLFSSGLPRMDPQHWQVPGVSPAFCLEVLYSCKDLFSMWRPIIGPYQLIHKPRKSGKTLYLLDFILALMSKPWTLLLDSDSKS